MDAGLAGLIVGLLTLGLYLWDRPLIVKMYNLLAHGAHHVQALADKMTFRGTVSARLIRKDGTTVDLGELKPPQ